MIGEKFQQSKKLEYILDNIKNFEIHYTNTEINLLDQIKKIKKNQKNTNIIYEIKKSNNQEQEKVIQQLKEANRLITKIDIIISDDQDNEEAKKIKNKLQSYLNVQTYNLQDYFKSNYNYDKYIELNEKLIAMFISKEQDIKNQIFQTAKSPNILQNKWALINTPQFNINQDVELKNETIKEFSKIFKTYSTQISYLFIILDQERDDIVKKNFLELFTQFKNFKQNIIVLLYNRFDENFEQNLNLNNFFLKIAKIRKVYSLSNSQLKNQQQIDEYFYQILNEQQDDIKIGIDIKDTIFEIKDEKQSELEKHTIEQEFYQAKSSKLQQNIDQDDQQIILYKMNNEDLNKKISELYKQIAENNYKITELERSKYQQYNELRELEREMRLKQNIIDRIQIQTENLSQNSQQAKIISQKEQQIKNGNQVINDIKDSSTITQNIQILEKEKQLINQQLQECYTKLDNRHNIKNQKKQQEQEKELNSQIENLWQQINDFDSKIKENTQQLEVIKQDMKKDNKNLQQPNNQYKSRNYNDTSKISINYNHDQYSYQDQGYY